MTTLEIIEVEGGYVVRHIASGQYFTQQVSGRTPQKPVDYRAGDYGLMTAAFSPDIASARLFTLRAQAESMEEFESYQLGE